ncbi:MAG: type IV pilus twitching motility protein PilT [Fimbriimonadaceae bacterium]
MHPRIESLLRKTVEMDGSDLHFKTDSGKIYVRVYGELVHLQDEAPLFSDEFKEALFQMFTDEQKQRYYKEHDLDFATEVSGVARFRGNVYQQRNCTQAAFRVIPYTVKSMEELRLPPAAFDFITKPRGLVLVTGPAGSGKSTTLASMMDRINSTEPLHIVTVEDPIEFVHKDKMSLINQRELYEDTMTFYNALKYVLRQDPDVILVGEMRDLETIHQAITSAETGHLVFATLHTVDAVQTVDRIIDVFPTHQQQQIRMQLSVNLVGVISQTLVKRKDGKGRIAAYEALVATNAIRNLIRENKSFQINSMIQTGMKQKMQTLDQSLAHLVCDGFISMEDGVHRAKDPGEFKRLIALMNSGESGGGQSPGGPPPANPPQPPSAPPSGVRGQPNRPQINRGD